MLLSLVMLGLLLSEYEKEILLFIITANTEFINIFVFFYLNLERLYRGLSSVPCQITYFPH